MATNSTKELQHRLFEQVKMLVSPNISLADELSELLEVSTDSVYRRMRGETDVSIDETALICKHFKVSIDSLFSTQSDLVSFSYKSFVGGKNGFEKYLKSIDKDLETISSFKNKKIVYAAEDVPIFHHFQFKELASFKLFYWQKAILIAKEYEGKKFNLKHIPESQLKITTDIYKKYCTIPSIEIWTEQTINSTLKQIEFFWEAGHFEKQEDALLICDQVRLTIETLQINAEKESKLKNDSFDEEKNFTLYASDVMIGNNFILVNMNDVYATYLSFNTFNTLVTSNESFCSETSGWLKNLIKKSELISGVSEKQRARFFRKINHQINETKKRIELG